MNYTLQHTMTMLAELSSAGQIKISRNWADFTTDTLVKSANCSSLLGLTERFAEEVHADVEFVKNMTTVAFMGVLNEPDAPGVVSWIRKNATMASAILQLYVRTKKEDNKKRFYDALEDVSTSILSCDNMGVAMPGATPDIAFTLRTLSPLSHGADRKAGNSTLFRRQEVLSTTDQTLTLPIYGANAVRGILRRELADDFVQQLGLSCSRSQSPLTNWFLAALYNGGTLKENSAEAKAVGKHLGNAGTMKVSGIHEFRDMVPPLSVMGVSLGNRTLPRHGFDNFPGEPRCLEWNNGGTLNATELFTWEFLMHKDDMEFRPIGSEEKSAQMIANTECLKRGVTLQSGIDLTPMAQPVERACVGRALELLARRGKIGANNRYGQSFVQMDIHSDIPESRPYLSYIETHKSEILSYLRTIGALRDDAVQLDSTRLTA